MILTGPSCLAEGVACHSSNGESLGTCCSGTTCEMQMGDTEMEDMEGTDDMDGGYIMDTRKNLRQDTMEEMNHMKYCMSSSTMTSYDMTKTKPKTKTRATTTAATTVPTSATPRRPRQRPSREKDILADRCWADCELTDKFLSNPACLMDCFPPHHCLTSLLLDFTGAGGVCGGTFVNSYYPKLWPRSDRNCTFLQETDNQFTAREDYQLKAGVCSETTEALLKNQRNCIAPLLKQKKEVLGNLQYLIWSTCSWKTFEAWKPKPTTLELRSPLSNPFRYGINQNIYGKIIFYLKIW